ncbi:uncharacterized protein BDV17DRAFT_126881 [Aspergillus undulatus]|uniref:uncharacterized protein n=1 Tax=Aspergillus undulatus TaxID=1810928 RepID=UPI003CCE4659
MALSKRFSELTGLDITNLISSVVEGFADKSAYSLGESKHAPTKENREVQHFRQTRGNRTEITHLPTSSPRSHFSPSSSSPSFPSPVLSHTLHHNTSHHNSFLRPSNDNPATMGQLADIDDTAAFMAAARSFKLEKEYGKPPAASEDAASDQQGLQGPHDAVEDFAAPADSGFSGFDVALEPGVGGTGDFVDFDVNEADPSPNLETDRIATSLQPLNVGSPVFIPGSDVNEPEVRKSPDKLTATNLSAFVAQSRTETEENREHLKAFKNWGTPAARDKPAAQIRRVIIKGLPPSWATPDKVLSVVHGGVIESVSITPNGNAHVLFCDPDACKAFYDKYPNGIDLDKERKLTVFVDLGEDVDVVSSQLSFNLSVGSTRVVRAVGVDMEATMTEIVSIATASNRKVEKIVDNFVPGYPRSVSFRFCSIDDAVRFRAAIVRNEDWEQCNVQYATDPCEVANGYHAD